MNNYQLENIINKKLMSHAYRDIIPNGLQVEGCSNITKIITGVTICQKLIDLTIQHSAQAIIVHHGFFWQNESQKIKQIKKNRLKSILCNDINMYSWHLPLDIHNSLGNNVQIAKQLNINISGKISDVILWGTFNPPITIHELLNTITIKFKRRPVYFSHSKNSTIHSIAWCSGKGQKFIKYAIDLKLDAYLTGEVSEETMHYAYENNIHFISAGHYATERYGIQALGTWIAKKCNLDVVFIDINNPI